MNTITRRRIATRPGVLSAIWRPIRCWYLRWAIAADEDYLALLKNEKYHIDEPAFRSRIEQQRCELARWQR